MGFDAVKVDYVFFEGFSKQMRVEVGEDGVVFEVKYAPVPGDCGGVYEDTLEVGASMYWLVFDFSCYVHVELLDY